MRFEDFVLGAINLGALPGRLTAKALESASPKSEVRERWGAHLTQCGLTFLLGQQAIQRTFQTVLPELKVWARGGKARYLPLLLSLSLYSVGTLVSLGLVRTFIDCIETEDRSEYENRKQVSLIKKAAGILPLILVAAGFAKAIAGGVRHSSSFQSKRFIQDAPVPFQAIFNNDLKAFDEWVSKSISQGQDLHFQSGPPLNTSLVHFMLEMRKANGGLGDKEMVSFFNVLTKHLDHHQVLDLLSQKNDRGNSAFECCMADGVSEDRALNELQVAVLEVKFRALEDWCDNTSPQNRFALLNGAQHEGHLISLLKVAKYDEMRATRICLKMLSELSPDQLLSLTLLAKHNQSSILETTLRTGLSEIISHLTNTSFTSLEIKLRKMNADQRLGWMQNPGPRMASLLRVFQSLQGSSGGASTLVVERIERALSIAMEGMGDEQCLDFLLSRKFGQSSVLQYILSNHSSKFAAEQLLKCQYGINKKIESMNPQESLDWMQKPSGKLPSALGIFNDLLSASNEANRNSVSFFVAGTLRRVFQGLSNQQRFSFFHASKNGQESLLEFAVRRMPTTFVKELLEGSFNSIQEQLWRKEPKERIKWLENAGEGVEPLLVFLGKLQNGAFSTNQEEVKKHIEKTLSFVLGGLSESMTFQLLHGKTEGKESIFERVLRSGSSAYAQLIVEKSKKYFEALCAQGRAGYLLKGDTKQASFISQLLQLSRAAKDGSVRQELQGYLSLALERASTGLSAADCLEMLHCNGSKKLNLLEEISDAGFLPLLERAQEIYLEKFFSLKSESRIDELLEKKPLLKFLKDFSGRKCPRVEISNANMEFYTRAVQILAMISQSSPRKVKKILAQEDQKGEPALHYVISGASSPVLQALLEAASRVSLLGRRDRQSRTVGHLLAANSNCDLDTFQVYGKGLGRDYEQAFSALDQQGQTILDIWLKTTLKALRPGIFSARDPSGEDDNILLYLLSKTPGRDVKIQHLKSVLEKPKFFESSIQKLLKKLPLESIFDTKEKNPIFLRLISEDTEKAVEIPVKRLLDQDKSFRRHELERAYSKSYRGTGYLLTPNEMINLINRGIHKAIEKGLYLQAKSLMDCLPEIKDSGPIHIQGGSWLHRVVNLEGKFPSTRQNAKAGEMMNAREFFEDENIDGDFLSSVNYLIDIYNNHKGEDIRKIGNEKGRIPAQVLGMHTWNPDRRTKFVKINQAVIPRNIGMERLHTVLNQVYVSQGWKPIGESATAEA